jgi:hypothetical protein
MKVVKRTCPWCGQENSVEMTDEQYDEYTTGASTIQRIFPELTPATREILITGICGKCWDKYLG